MEKEYLSGSELRQYLHISTRKMKYLMDHDYIPHEDTGQATHKYRVRREDAIAFKQRMETEPGFLSELTGCFNNGGIVERSPAGERAVIDSQGFQNYLLLLWASLPEALPTQEAARRIGVNPQRLHELIRAGKLHGVKIGRVQYCVKREIIAYAAAPARLAHPSGEVYKALVAGYWKEREKQPGDCFAYSGQSPGAML